MRVGATYSRIRPRSRKPTAAYTRCAGGVHCRLVVRHPRERASSNWAVQGGLVPAVAHQAKVPMRVLEPEPWALGMRFRNEPTGLRRYHVHRKATADGCAIADLALGENTWISMINRGGTLIPVQGDTILHAGDEVLLLTDPHTSTDPQPLFTGIEPPDVGPPRPPDSAPSPDGVATPC